MIHSQQAALSRLYAPAREISTTSIKEGLYVAKTPDELKYLLANTNTQAVVLDFAKIGQAELIKIQDFLSPLLETRIIGNKILSPTKQICSSAQKLIDWCRENGATGVGKELHDVFTFMSSLYASTFASDRIKQVIPVFPEWPERFSDFKADHLLTFVPHSHAVNFADWKKEDGVEASKWYIDLPLLGPGMLISNARTNYKSIDHSVTESLERLKDPLKQKEKVSASEVLDLIQKYWSQIPLSRDEGVKIPPGTPVLLRYQSESFDGSIHWRQLAFDKHKGNIAPSVNLMFSGGTAPWQAIKNS